MARAFDWKCFECSGHDLIEHHDAGKSVKAQVKGWPSLDYTRYSDRVACTLYKVRLRRAVLGTGSPSNLRQALPKRHRTLPISDAVGPTHSSDGEGLQQVRYHVSQHYHLLDCYGRVDRHVCVLARFMMQLSQGCHDYIDVESGTWSAASIVRHKKNHVFKSAATSFL